jgi:hypothetical protein
MSAVPAGAIAPQGWRRRAIGLAATFTDYLFAEFAAHPKRPMRAVRLGMIASVGMCLMAAAHVENTLGPYILWAVAAAPRAMMTPYESSRLIVTQGAMLALSAPIAGIFVETPWIQCRCFRSSWRATRTWSAATTCPTRGS